MGQLNEYSVRTIIVIGTTLYNIGNPSGHQNCPLFRLQGLAHGKVRDAIGGQPSPTPGMSGCAAGGLPIGPEVAPFYGFIFRIL